MTESDFHRCRDESLGICLACNSERDCCEPDARNYECYNCGKRQVYGIEELLIMGLLSISSDDPLESEGTDVVKGRLTKTEKRAEELRKNWKPKRKVAED